MNWKVRPLSVISARTDMEIRGPKSKCNRWKMKGRGSERQRALREIAFMTLGYEEKTENTVLMAWKKMPLREREDRSWE